MRRTHRPILVTGAHRSGTTWVGRNLALDPRARYISEPFNVGIDANLVACPLEHWFQFISEDNGSKYEQGLREVIYPARKFTQKLIKVRAFRRLASVLRDQGLAMLRGSRTIPIMKDPIAFFSAEWLSRTYGMRVVVLIRHPAAFCSSLKLKNWTFDFNEFVNQPQLMRRYLGAFESEIRELADKRTDIVEQAILLWNCIYHTASVYRAEHPEWLFVRHEDLSNDPVGQFRAIFDRLGLRFTHKAEVVILDNSGSHNPAEQHSSDELKRDSRSNIHNWRKRLTEDEIQRVKAGTHEIATMFYSEHEW